MAYYYFALMTEQSEAVKQWLRFYDEDTKHQTQEETSLGSFVPQLICVLGKVCQEPLQLGCKAS